MLFTLGIAGGLSAAIEVNRVDLGDFGVNATLHRIATGMFCALMIWVAVGLASQVWDIARYLRSDPNIVIGQKSALLFDLFWRLTIALLLPGTYLLQRVGNLWQTPKAELSPLGILLNPTHLDELRWLLLLIAIGASRGFRTNRLEPHTACPILNIVGWLAGIVLATIVILDSGLVPSLVIIAVNGVEAAHRLYWKRAPIGLEFTRIQSQFMTAATIQLACALLALNSAIWRPAMAKRSDSRSPYLPTILTILFALMAIAGEAWIRFDIWPRFSPSFIAAIIYVPQLAKLLILSFAVAYLAARTSYLHSNASPASWRIHPHGYLHERRSILAIAFLVAIVQISQYLIEGIAIQRSLSPMTGLSSMEHVFGFLLWPATYWPWAIALVSAREFRNTTRSESSIVKDFSWPRFLTNLALYSLVALGLDYAICNWRIAAWLSIGSS